MRRLVTIAAVASVVVLLSASSCDRRGLGDAPVGSREEAPRKVIVMPDQFPNLAVYCDGSTALYVNTRSGGQTAVVPDSTHCREGGSK